MVAYFLIFFLALFLSACDKPLRLPYIAPELHNWPKSYKGVAGLKLRVFNTGTLVVPRKLVYRDGSLLGTASLDILVFVIEHQPMARMLDDKHEDVGSLLGTASLDILVFVIEHPRHGLILVGTGLNRKIADNAERYMGTFRTSAGTPMMEKGQDILSQLKRAKLPGEKVRHIILLDLRLDHTGELESFPLARPIVASAEYEAATDEKDSALSLPKEYDDVHQWRFIDFAGTAPLGTFRA